MPRSGCSVLHGVNQLKKEMALVCGYPPFSLSSAFIKQASFCFCFRSKQKGIIIEESLNFLPLYSFKNFSHYKVSEWVGMINRSLHLIFLLQFYIMVRIFLEYFSLCAQNPLEIFLLPNLSSKSLLKPPELKKFIRKPI